MAHRHKRVSKTILLPSFPTRRISQSSSKAVFSCILSSRIRVSSKHSEPSTHSAFMTANCPGDTINGFQSLTGGSRSRALLSTTSNQNCQPCLGPCSTALHHSEGDTRSTLRSLRYESGISIRWERRVQINSKSKISGFSWEDATINHLSLCSGAQYGWPLVLTRLYFPQITR